jgi:hypothetical protein
LISNTAALADLIVCVDHFRHDRLYRNSSDLRHLQARSG